ncbi:hypothetical protein F441_06542 [Phytophthora nicotianae CJ01A1]|uniref:LCCL domain-containing protein n=2 Tax=Phytophthora nicotianae TaxID=4792 RepID=W2XC70_PHYNI|nr:hypothetical protein F444_06602 [Phytophthora nicotianae P1976]ETP19534.1 hypothetical protein F441_06542 [Phytophthora nicotianae CJ01A1]
MSREPGVRPLPFSTGGWRRRSHSEKKVPVELDCSKHSLQDCTASVQSVQPIALKHVVVVWLSKNCIVLIYFSVSLALLVLLVYLSFFAASMDDGSQPDFLSCRSWGFGTSCDQSSSMAVFGSSPYRADSRICRAAAHAGVVGPNGGCAFYRFAGAADAYYPSTANMVTTKKFLSWFPKTIEFKEASSTYCSDLSWWILSVGFITTAGFGLLPRARLDVMFYLLVAWGFFYTRLVGQPSSQDYAGISINSFGEVMFLLAASSLAYRLAVSDTFCRWKSLTLKRRFIMWTLCYVVPYHVMINMNLIGYIPWLNVDLGGYEELHANAGTYVVFTLVGIGAVFLASQLFRSMYLGGKWRVFVVMYMTVFAPVLLSWALFPSTSFHLHHTMLGALIIPVTSFPTPAAAFSQAAAIGLFVQGYARWGWHSYLDTIPTYLTIAVPEKAPNTTNVTSSWVRVVWEPLESVQAYSLQLNRVEVYRGVDTSAVISNLKPNMTYFIAQLHSSAVALDMQTRSYRVGHAHFNRAQVVGVLVKRNNSHLKLDDGTGLLDVKLVTSLNGFNQKELHLGALVECVGSIDELQPSSDMTRSRRWMNATHFHEVHDRNVETLRMLEVMHLYQNDYAVPHSSPPTQLELLAFPPIHESSAGRSAVSGSESNSTTVQQHAIGHQASKPAAAATLIEKPWEQQNVGVPGLDAAIPPADYQFALPERDHQLIEQGSKSLEIRLNDAPYSIIHVNDRITINGKTLTTVVAIRKYASLQSVLEAENVNALLPQSSFVGAGTFNAAAAAERHYRQFFSAEEEEHYGLIVFQLSVTSSGPKSQEEWSALVLRQLEAKRDAGCSIADLRFAFPSLPVDQITEILTNLQFDALVICMNDKYRLV